jgi:hypothetical protein
VLFEYDTNEGIYTTWDEVYSNEDSETEVLQDLEENYSNGTSAACYYQSDDPSDMRLELHSATVFLVFGIIFAILYGAAMLGWIGFEVWNRFFD